MPNPIINRILDNLRWTPAKLPGLQVWLRADTGRYQDTAFGTPAAADADPVGGWRDQSGQNNHATQATAGKRPTAKLASLNGHPVVRGDGVDDGMTTPTITAGLRVVCAVLRRTADAAPPGNRWAWDQFVDNNNRFGLFVVGTTGLWSTLQNAAGVNTQLTSTTAATTTPVVVTVWLTGSGYVLRINGTQEASGTERTIAHGSAPLIVLAFNTTFTASGDIDVGSLVGSSSVVKLGDVQRLERYLGRAYGVRVA